MSLSVLFPFEWHHLVFGESERAVGGSYLEKPAEASEETYCANAWRGQTPGLQRTSLPISIGPQSFFRVFILWKPKSLDTSVPAFFRILQQYGNRWSGEGGGR